MCAGFKSGLAEIFWSVMWLGFLAEIGFFSFKMLFRHIFTIVHWAFALWMIYIVGSMEVRSKAFLLVFLLLDWIKLNHLKSKKECGFLDIFSRHICSTVAETIDVTSTQHILAQKSSENHIWRCWDDARSVEPTIFLENMTYTSGYSFLYPGGVGGGEYLGSNLENTLDLWGHVREKRTS